MIQSMTGYGKKILQLPTKKISIEIKSLNSKSLDLNVRLPIHLKEKELTIRKKIAQNLIRGKVDFSIYIENTAGESSSKINKEVVKHHMEQLKEISDGDDLQLLQMAIQLPDALQVEREELDEKEWNEIESGIDEAISDIQTYRTEEGLALGKDFEYRIDLIKEALVQVEALDVERVKKMKEKLRIAINELKQDIDENRFEQELIYYLEKLDITEEKVRLENHLNYFNQVLESKDSEGKKMGFVLQEIGREINTIGSKSNDASLQKKVIFMKNEMEKIKEQILNIL